MAEGPEGSEQPAESFISKMKRLLMGKNTQNPARTRTYRYGCCFHVLLVIFILSTMGCIVMWFTDLYLDSILNQMTLKNGTDIFKAWEKPPIKPLICVHIFNYTNYDSYLSGKANKITVNDTGPYCYRETLLKTHIKFFDNGTVSYGDKRTHKFEPKNSSGNVDDILIVPNLPLISAVGILSNKPTLIQLTARIALSQYDMPTMIRVPAHKFLFGYDDSLVRVLIGVAKFFTSKAPFENFGILAVRAAETDERITVHTGAEDLNSIGKVTALDGKTNMGVWDEPECNRLDGSDGAFFPRHEINESATLYLFHKDLCRRLPLVFQSHADFQDGVMGMRFHTPPDVFNVTGTCYCKEGKCPPAGTFDVSPCKNGAPIMMSFPHFLNAEPSVTEHLDGLHPNPKRHDFFIDIQPVLGFTLGTVSRIQLNIQIRQAYWIDRLREFTDGIILPVVWFEVTADRLPPDLFKMIYHASVTVQWIQWALQWGFLGIAVLCGLGILLLTRGCCNHSNQATITSDARKNQQRPNKEVIVLKMTSL